MMPTRQAKEVKCHVLSVMPTDAFISCRDAVSRGRDGGTAESAFQKKKFFLK